MYYNGDGNGTPLQYSCLENPMDRGAWWAAAHGVAKSQAQLSDFTFTFHFHALEKEMATHSSVLAWRIPQMGEPGGLPSMGSHRVGNNWSNLAAAAAAMYYKTRNVRFLLICTYLLFTFNIVKFFWWHNPVPFAQPPGCPSQRLGNLFRDNFSWHNHAVLEDGWPVSKLWFCNFHTLCSKISFPLSLNFVSVI